MMPMPTRHKHPSSGANRPSDIAVTVNINAEFNLMAVKLIFECIWRDLVPEYCHSLESSTVYIAPPVVVNSLPGRSNRSRPRLLLPTHGEEMIPTFLTSNIYTGLCLPNALTLTWLRSYEMVEHLRIVRIHTHVSFREFSTSPCQEKHIHTRGQMGFLSSRQFRSIYNSTSELHPFIFA